MNRILKRPMFRMGGSAGTGITSGLDQPRKQYANGTPNPYAAPLAPGTLPGFLTSFGLDLLSRPPQGNIFQTAAAAARGPFETFQMANLEAGRTRAERDFKRDLLEQEKAFTTSEREASQDFESEQLQKRLDTQEKIANLASGDLDKKAMEYAKIYQNPDGSPNEIKGYNAAKFADVYPTLVQDYGAEFVSLSPIDATQFIKKRDYELFKDQNPGAESKIFYDVASGKPVRLVRNVATDSYAFIPADSSELDLSGENMPAPEEDLTPGLFGQKSKPDRPLKEVLPDLREGTGFDEEFYQ